jgi:hypothetical protein
MIHTIQNLKTSKLNLGFEFHQLLIYLKHVINLVMQIRYTVCHTCDPLGLQQVRAGLAGSVFGYWHHSTQC